MCLLAACSSGVRGARRVRRAARGRQLRAIRARRPRRRQSGERRAVDDVFRRHRAQWCRVRRSGVAGRGTQAVGVARSRRRRVCAAAPGRRPCRDRDGERQRVLAEMPPTARSSGRRTSASRYPGSSLPCGDVDPVGITSTPVVDANANRIYVVGMVPAGSPHVVRARPVDGARSSPRSASTPTAQTRRCTTNERRSRSRTARCSSPTAGATAIAATTTAGWSRCRSRRPGWGRSRRTRCRPRARAGSGPRPGAAVAADGSLYLTSGNSSSTGTYDYGNSVVRLSPDLKLLDSFAPTNWAALNRERRRPRFHQPGAPSRQSRLPGRKERDRLPARRRTPRRDRRPTALGRVCNGGRAFGGIAHDGNTLFVPCSSGVVQVVVTGDTFSVGWTAPLSTPGPTIIAGGWCGPSPPAAAISSRWTPRRARPSRRNRSAPCRRSSHHRRQVSGVLSSPRTGGCWPSVHDREV